MAEVLDLRTVVESGWRNYNAPTCLISSFPEASLIVKQGQVVFANNSFYDFFNLNPADVERTSLRDVLKHIAVPSTIIDILTSADGTVGPIGSEATGQGGVRRIFRIYRFKVGGCSSHGPVDAVMFIDDTPLREVQRATEVPVEQLLRADRQAALGEMALALAHEINQPLDAIVNFAGAARHTLKGRAIRANELDEVLTNIGAEALRAGEVIKSLRSFLRGTPPAAGPADINAAVRMVLGFAEPSLREQSVATELQLAANVPTVQADRIILQQIILNLVTNAIQAVQGLPPYRRQLFIATFAESEVTVAIIVRDSGVGLPQDLGERIFDPFVTTKENGSGLGLPIARTLVQRLGGSIEVRPTEGWGASFIIRLPCRSVEGYYHA